MRESNYTYPPQNRAVISITQMLYDRRALDTSSPLALLNNLTSLTYLTSTSPRIREILTCDGGLERLLDILRDSCLPMQLSTPADLWGLNGPPTARVIELNRQISLRQSLAFQCVVNIGVRGSEAIRTRVVQAGALDIVAQILESWLMHRKINIYAGSLGSQDAVDAVAAGRPVPGTEMRRRARAGSHRHTHSSVSASATVRVPQNSTMPPMPRTNSGGGRSRSVDAVREAQSDTDAEADVDMADAENDEGTDAGSIGGNDSAMDIDEQDVAPRTTPRATTSLLPLNIVARPPSGETHSQASSAGNSVSGDELDQMPRAISDQNLAAPRPLPINITAARLPLLAQDQASNQSSPMGTPTRLENVEAMRPGRRGTIVGRPINLAPRPAREHAESGTSDGGEDIDLPSATILAGVASANAAALENGPIGTEHEQAAPDVEIVETQTGIMQEDSDADFMAAEQARLDLEAGAPPGQPGAVQTPQAAVPTPQAAVAPVQAGPPAQIIIANGAPRGFQDLGSYVGISSLLNPNGDNYSDDSILLALQLLAYLSKYPHVRTCFHNPRRPMHATFDLGNDRVVNPLPERPSVSSTPNIFSLVERYTFRPSAADPLLFRVPAELQYWAGVIMRNACRKDEAQGGVRQCANMSCGKWETGPREFAKCRRCRKAKYCSKECQSRAWQEGHRFWCNPRDDNPVPGQAIPSEARTNAVGDEDDEYAEIFGTALDLPRDILVQALHAAQALSGRSRHARPEDVHAQRPVLDNRTSALFNFVRETLRYHIQRRTPEEQQQFYEFIRSHPNSLRGLLLQTIQASQGQARQQAVEQAQAQQQAQGNARLPPPPANTTNNSPRGPAPTPTNRATQAGPARSLWQPTRAAALPSPDTRGLASIDAPVPTGSTPPRQQRGEPSVPPARNSVVSPSWTMSFASNTVTAPSVATSALRTASRPAAASDGREIFGGGAAGGGLFATRPEAATSNRRGSNNNGNAASAVTGLGMGIGIPGMPTGNHNSGASGSTAPASVSSRFSLSDIWRGMRSDRDGPAS